MATDVIYTYVLLMHDYYFNAKNSPPILELAFVWLKIEGAAQLMIIMWHPKPSLYLQSDTVDVIMDSCKKSSVH